ncbi:recombinase family protein [Eubacterium ramulus]
MEEGRIFGYARVSSKDQNLDRQILALEEYVERKNIVVDKASGANLNREGYKALKGVLGLRAGDTLYITSLDRLSRNKRQIKEELQWFKDNNIRLKILDLPTSLIEVPPGQKWLIEMITDLLVEVLASMAQQERLTTKKRQREGIEAAKKKGKHLGRPRLMRPAEFEKYYVAWKAREITAKYAMKQLNLPSSSFYKLVKQYEAENSTKV